MLPLLITISTLFSVNAMPAYHTLYHESKDSPDIYQDVKLSEADKFLHLLPKNSHFKLYMATVNHKEKQWPMDKKSGKVIVPYTFKKQKKEEVRKLKHAMQVIQAMTCFKFVPRTNQKDYITFMPDGACYSHIGKQGGSQYISLFGWCTDLPYAIHDILHALGADHEHQRPDRDEHVTVHWDNVDMEFQKKWHVYDIREYGHFDPKEYPYDFESIMHYHSRSYGVKDANGKSAITITKKNGDMIYLNKMITPMDMKKLNQFAGCKADG